MEPYRHRPYHSSTNYKSDPECSSSFLVLERFFLILDFESYSWFHFSWVSFVFFVSCVQCTSMDEFHHRDIGFILFFLNFAVTNVSTSYWPCSSIHQLKNPLLVACHFYGFVYSNTFGASKSEPGKTLFILSKKTTSRISKLKAFQYACAHSLSLSHMYIGHWIFCSEGGAALDCWSLSYQMMKNKCHHHQNHPRVQQP